MLAFPRRHVLTAARRYSTQPAFLADILGLPEAPSPGPIPLKYPRTEARQNAQSDKPAAAPLLKHVDPGIEQRRAARLAREAARAAKVGSRRDNNDAPRSRKPSHRDMVSRNQDSSKHMPSGGTERARLQVSKAGAAEAIMAFAQPDPESSSSPSDGETDASTTPLSAGIDVAISNRHRPTRRVAKARKEDAEGVLTEESSLSIELPEYSSPEPVATDIDVPPRTISGASSLTQPIPQIMPNISKDRIKKIYGGDYHAYESSSQEYLQGTQGLKSAYAKIVVQRNRSVPLEQQKQLLNLVQKVTREDAGVVAKTV